MATPPEKIGKLENWSFQGVAMFDLTFLGRFFTNIGSFCAHWKGNFLNFSKLTLLLVLANF